MKTIACIGWPGEVHRFADLLREELLEPVKFAVVSFESLDRFLNWFNHNKTNVAGVVTEVMLEPAKTFRHMIVECKDGTRTGLVLHAVLREMKSDLPIAFLSVVKDPETIADLRSRPNTTFHSQDAMPYDVIDALGKQFGVPMK